MGLEGVYLIGQFVVVDQPGVGKQRVGAALHGGTILALPRLLKRLCGGHQAVAEALDLAAHRLR